MKRHTYQPNVNFFPLGTLHDRVAFCRRVHESFRIHYCCAASAKMAFREGPAQVKLEKVANTSTQLVFQDEGLAVRFIRSPWFQLKISKFSFRHEIMARIWRAAAAMYKLRPVSGISRLALSAQAMRSSDGAPASSRANPRFGDTWPFVC